MWKHLLFLVFVWKAMLSPTEEVLKLPEVIAQSKGYRIVVCVDEFQQIGDFPDSLTFQKKLRGIWQLQSHVSYCLYGGKKHMMEQMFQNQSYPFYRFGDFFYLNKIGEKDLVMTTAPKHLDMSDPILALWLKKRVWKE